MLKNSSFPEKQLQDRLQGILAVAKQQGATALEACISVVQGFSVCARSGEVETLEHHDSKSLFITAYKGQRVGSTETTDLSDQAIHKCIEKAIAIAHYTSEDPFNGLADNNLLAYDYPDLKLNYPWDITPQQAITAAIACEAELLASDKRIKQSEGVSIDTFNGRRFYANSQGFSGTYPSTSHTMSCDLIASVKDDMQRDGEYTTNRNPAKLQDIKALGKAAVENTVQRLGARRLTTRKCPVIFTADLARSLIGNFLAAISGGNQYRKTSFLLDSLGQQLFPDFISIEQKPHLLGAKGSRPFDADGVRTQDLAIVEQGVLQSYLLSTYSARQLKMQTTGNAGSVQNILISDSGLDFKALLQKMETGLLVTELMGQGVNKITGDYSRGAFGYWVEKGEIQYPVQEITIAGNLRDMFKDIVAMSNDVDQRGRVCSGSVLIDGMTVSGE